MNLREQGCRCIEPIHELANKITRNLGWGIALVLIILFDIIKLLTKLTNESNYKDCKKSKAEEEPTIEKKENMISEIRTLCNGVVYRALGRIMNISSVSLYLYI